jgi:hypothetical protein
MSPRTLFVATIALSAPAAFAQTNGLQDGGFETACYFCGHVDWAEGWPAVEPGGTDFVQRRVVGDGLTPTFYPVGNPSNPPGALTPHSGNACIQMGCDGNGGFFGITTDTVNYCYCDQTCSSSCTGPYPFFDPAYDYNQGDVVVTGWYMIPTDQPITGDAASIKINIKYGNYDLATLENYASDGTGGSIIGTTNGQWRLFTVTFTKAAIQQQYECNVGIQPNCYCMGCEPPNPPTHCKLTPSRFVGDGTPTSGVIYWDDITYSQLPAHHCDSADFNCDGDFGTDSDIEAFFLCLAGTCPPPPCTNNADFNNDGDVGTDADIEAFFRVLAGGSC